MPDIPAYPLCLRPELAYTPNGSCVGVGGPAYRQDGRTNARQQVVVTPHPKRRRVG